MKQDASDVEQQQLENGNSDKDQLQRLELEQLSRDELIDEVVALRRINDSRPPSSWMQHFCSKRVLVATFILTAQFWLGCSFTILTVTLPLLQEELHCSEALVQWVVIAPMTINSMLIIGSGKLADVYGRKAVYVVGYSIVSIGMLVSGLAPSIEILIIGRLLHGMGQSMTGPSGTAIVLSMWPKNNRGLVIGVQSFIGFTAPSFGVVVGGFIVESFSWRLIFLAPLPVVIVAFLIAYSLMEDPPDAVKNTAALRNFDLRGMVLMALSIGPFLLVINQGARLGWYSPPLLAMLTVCIASSAHLQHHERHVAVDPILPPVYFADKQILLCVLCYVAAQFCYLGMFMIMVSREAINREAINRL
jgi:MFS family permease